LNIAYDGSDLTGYAREYIVPPRKCPYCGQPDCLIGHEAGLQRQLEILTSRYERALEDKFRKIIVEVLEKYNLIEKEQGQ